MNIYTYTIDEEFVIIFKNGNEWKRVGASKNKSANKRWAERIIEAQVDREIER